LGPWPGNISAEGILYDVDTEWEPGRRGSLDPDAYTSFIVGIEIGDDELTELGRFEYPPSPDPVTFEAGGLFVVPFTSWPFLRVGPAGWIWHADSGEPWVYRRGLTDDSERRFGRDLPSVPVTEADRAAVAAEPWLSRLRDAPPGVLAAYLRMIPDTKTHLQGFFFDDADRVWIVHTNPDPQSERLTVDVYDSSSEWVGRAEVAVALEPMPRVRGDLLAGVVRDELDVESVVLFRLR
jgi:hypothetical protein